MIALAIACCCATAAPVNVDDASISVKSSGDSVKVYRGSNLIGTYSNLTTSTGSFDSAVEPSAGNGAVVDATSDGGRFKYHIIVPLRISGGGISTNCVYKSIYDSVENRFSVGTSCEGETELGKLDPSSAVSEKNTVEFGPSRALKGVLAKECPSGQELKYGKFTVVRCAADDAGDLPGKLKIVVSDNQRVIFSVAGFEFVPKANGHDFALYAQAATGDRTLLFEGDLDCISSSSPPTASALNATIGTMLKINYSLAATGGCYSGTYKYSGHDDSIQVAGSHINGKYQLLEKDNAGHATGFFLLDRIEPSMSGDWVGVAKKKVMGVK
jgi:hypothetical protein